MEAGKLDIQINQGAQFRLELTVYDEDDALIDLSGWPARMKIKSVTDQLLVSLTTTPTANGDVLTLGGAAGTVRIFVSTDTTDPLDFVEGKYDIELVDPLSQVDRYLTQDVLRCLRQFGATRVSVLNTERSVDRSTSREDVPSVVELRWRARCDHAAISGSF
jgi:hypothetical protein